MVVPTKRKAGAITGWIFINRWVSGEKAEMEQEVIDRMFSTSPAVYGRSMPMKLPDHVVLPYDSEVALWKLDDPGSRVPHDGWKFSGSIVSLPSEPPVRMYDQNQCNEICERVDADGNL